MTDFSGEHMATFTRRKIYKNGGASYRLEGVNGSVYVSGGVFNAPKGDMPETIDLSSPLEFSTGSVKATARRAQVEANKAARLEKKAAKDAAKAEKKAAKETAKTEKAAAKAQAKAEKAAAKATVVVV
jgi:hypothetical protein